jgi:hypothetical protein
MEQVVTGAAADGGFALAAAATSSGISGGAGAPAGTGGDFGEDPDDWD